MPQAKRKDQSSAGKRSTYNQYSYSIHLGMLVREYGIVVRTVLITTFKELFDDCYCNNWSVRIGSRIGTLRFLRARQIIASLISRVRILIIITFMHYLIILGIGGNLFGQFLPSRELVMAVDDGDVVTVNVAKERRAMAFDSDYFFFPDLRGMVIFYSSATEHCLPPLLWRESWPH